MKTQLDDLIVNLTKIIWAHSSKTPKIILFLQDHLLMIRTIYLEMLKEDFYEVTTNRPQGSRNISMEEAIFNNVPNTRKAILNYLLLLYLLNQLGRTLNKQHKLSLKRFPRYYYIKFYRDKVAEHWDDYVFAIGPKGVRFQKGKAPIPDVTGYQHNRETLAKNLVSEFAIRKVIIKIPSRYIKYTMISSEKSYSEYMYKRLKKINKNFEIREETLISLLFEFGFPTPICDIEEYLIEISEYISKIVKRRKLL